MAFLFDRPAGWRYEPGRKKENLRDSYTKALTQLGRLDAKPVSDGATAQRLRQSVRKQLVSHLDQKGAWLHKRRPRGLRRSNPKSLDWVEQQMRELCLHTAKEKKLDTNKGYWIRKADIASRLRVPEHYVAQVVHLWNRAGVCSQGENTGVHDTHRSDWGGPWVSSWQDTLYTVYLDKLEHYFGMK